MEIRLAEKNFYSIEGEFSFRYGNEKMLIEDHLSDSERHIQAHTQKQAVFLFAKRFEKKFKRSVYIGDAKVEKVDPPEKIKRKQLKLF